MIADDNKIMITMVMNNFDLKIGCSPVVQYARRFAIGEVIFIDN